MLKKIAVTGPESTGKSALCEALAQRFKTVWVPEYARTYLDTVKRPYTPEDIEHIARGQLALEAQMLEKANALLFSDTDMLVIKIWFEHAFGYCPDWILKSLETCAYDLYLLCDVDIPWTYDPLREHPDKRAYFFNLYQKELDARNWPYFIVNGMGEMRVFNAASAVTKNTGITGF